MPSDEPKPPGRTDSTRVDPSDSTQGNGFEDLEGSLSDGVSLTNFAPSFASSHPPRAGQKAAPIETLSVGSRIDDFEIEGILGRGAFGCVYLARQMSLNRQVALKISQNQGHEGRTMAQLDHENIVQVFSETLSHDASQRLLCMQYVPGTTLEAVIRRMHGDQTRPWSGDSILQLIDELNPDPVPFHPAAMRERDELGNASSIEAVCWIGTRLSEALACAHQKGVLHRDIKPANILQTRHGRPLLADFNLSFQPIDVQSGRDSLFGGTLAYMSPEHLDAFHPRRPTERGAVDERSDIFSLGVVLYELACGHVGLPRTERSLDNLGKLERFSEARSRLPPAIGKHRSMSGRVLDHTLRTCMQPEPKERFQAAADLAASLDGCKALSEIERDLPAAGPMTRSALRHPFCWLVLLAILPHLPVGSAVNISYNAFRIVGHLTETQRSAFEQLVLVYNGTLYPVCFLVVVFLLRPVYRAWNRLHRDLDMVDEDEVDWARRFTLSWPKWAVILGCIGWIPGGVFFPLALHLIAGPVEPWVFVHFMISCTLSGLIAMTYSYFGIQYLVTRVFYPNLWGDARNLRETATEELKGVSAPMRRFQTLAGLVPLAGAVVVVGMGPEHESSVAAYQFLTITLIVLGFCGFQMANHGGALIRQTIDAMTKRRGSDHIVPD